jgi:hypothetical protein
VNVTIERPGPDLRSFDIDNDDVNSLFVFLDLWRPFSADFLVWLDGAGRELPWTYCDFRLHDLPEQYRAPFGP